MSVSEKQRSEIYGSIVGAVGEQATEFLMAQSPPGGWESLATSQALSELRADSNAQLVELRSDMDRGFADANTKLVELRSDMERGFADSNTKIVELRSDMEKGFAAVNARLGELSEKRGRDFYATIAAMVVMCIAVYGIAAAA